MKGDKQMELTFKHSYKAVLHWDDGSDREIILIADSTYEAEQMIKEIVSKFEVATAAIVGSDIVANAVVRNN
jgi:hypothetical protein